MSKSRAPVTKSAQARKDAASKRIMEEFDILEAEYRWSTDNTPEALAETLKRFRRVLNAFDKFEPATVAEARWHRGYATRTQEMAVAYIQRYGLLMAKAMLKG